MSCVLCYYDKSRLVREYRFWSVLVNRQQHTLGSCTIFLKRHVWHLSELSAEEFAEFFVIVKDFEGVFSRAFGSEHVNYGMFANLVRHVHWHIVPRFQNTVSFAGKSWSDKRWGSLPKFISRKSSKVLCDAILQKLKEVI